MATPGSESARQSALDSEEEPRGEGRSRYRSRRLPGVINDDSLAWDLNDDGRPKTRRVNPQRLALRLGPELVAEMEAYIVPGAKMPPFSIRKDFQERYSVDRRHIYDYFHSRGLRVAKEDKHTNLIRGRAMKVKILPLTLPISQTPTEVPSETMEASVDKTRPLLTPKSTNEAAVLRKQITKTRERKSGVIRRSIASLKRSRGSVSTMADSLPGEALSESGEVSVSGTDTDWDGVSISPQFTLPCDSSDESIAASSTSDFLSSPNDFLMGFLGTHDHLPQVFSEMEAFSVDEKLISGDQDRLLTKGERTELYDLISGSISSSVSVGASQPSDILSDVDSNNRAERLYHHVDAGKSHFACNPSLNTFESAHDLKTWLSDELDLQQSILDTHFFSSLREGLDGYAGLYDASFTPVDSSFARTGDYPQAAILSPQNRLPSWKVPVFVSCVKQPIGDHAKKDAENMHPSMHYNSR